MASELKLDGATTALVLIDLQRGIVGRELVPHPAETVLRNSSALAEAVRGSGGMAIYVHVLVDQIVRRETDAPSPGSGSLPPDASDLVPESGVQAGDVIVTKRQWGAFYGTDLDQQLRRRAIKTIIMAGIATNFGVESTAREAMDRGYELVFAEDAMTSVSADAHAFSIGTIFPRMGRVRSAEEVMAGLK